MKTNLELLNEYIKVRGIEANNEKLFFGTEKEPFDSAEYRVWMIRRGQRKELEREIIARLTPSPT